MNFEIRNRFSSAVIFTATLDDVMAQEPYSAQLGAAFRLAIVAKANLAGANLAGAYLAGANLAGANLAGADLARAYLAGANLAGAKISPETKLPPLSILPAGELIGWKKLRDGIITQLSIPAKAARVNSTGRKCRAEYVKTLALFDSDGKKLPKKHIGLGQRDRKTVYQAGKITRPDSFDPDFRVECSNGIHFFITREEAEAY